MSASSKPRPSSLSGVPAALVAVLLVATACGRSVNIDASTPIFTGLDPTVVAEVLSNPVAEQKIKEEPDETKEMLAQGMVENFIVCRQFLHAYQAWQRTGTAPPTPEAPKPVSPRSDWTGEFNAYAEPLRSGDIGQLRDALTNESGCGVWIPAKPGDVSGPTVAQVVKRGG